MTTPPLQPSGADDGRQPASVPDAPGEPEPVAVTAAVGPIPAIYIPRSPNKVLDIAGLLRQSAVRAARKAARWATRRLPHHRAKPRR